MKELSIKVECRKHFDKSETVYFIVKDDGLPYFNGCDNNFNADTECVKCGQAALKALMSKEYPHNP